MPCVNLALKHPRKQKPGFTIIEVMLVLGLTGLVLIGMLSVTFSSIASQRYNDSVRSFAEYLRTVYSEVISPATLGSGTSGQYVLGKLLVFGYPYGNAVDDRSIFAATIVSKNGDIPAHQDSFIAELAAVETQLYCDRTEHSDSDVQRYQPLWDAELRQINDPSAIPSLSTNNLFKGSVIIASSPTSGTVHTIYTSNTYNLRDQCNATNANASNNFSNDIKNNPPGVFVTETIGFCIKSDDSNLLREVRIAKDGRNTSAISIISDEVVDSWDDKGGNRCY